MNRIVCSILLLATSLALAACNLNNPSGTQAVVAFPAIGLAIQAQNGSDPLNAVGQTINYSYTVTNTGTMALPGSVTIYSDKAVGICPGLNSAGNLDSNFDPNEVIVCTGSYTLTQADLTAGSVTNTATASINGTNSSQANAVVTLAVVITPAVTSTPQATPTPSFVPGSTIQHKVQKGEWLLQIARCYGADYTATRRANPWIFFPDLIKPDTIVTVPNVGSKGTIYGPPCVKFHTVQAGDTWASIAQLYNADVVVLQAANRGVGLTAGQVVKVPVNSAGGATPAPGQTIATTTLLNALPTALTSGQGISFSGQVSANPAAPNGLVVKLQVQNGGCGSNAFTDLFQVVTAGGNGSFSGSFTVPSLAGTYGVRANSSGAISGVNTWQQSTSTCQTVTITVPPSSTKAITAFSFASPAVSGVINEGAHTIAVTVPPGTNVTALIPTIAHSGASINPASGAAQNFTAPVTYTVTAADGTTQPYVITVTISAPSSTKAITAFSFANPAVSGVINEGAHTISVTVPAGTNVTALAPTIAHSGASINPASGVAQSFTGAVTYTVTAADGTTQPYTVTVTVAASSTKAITAFGFASPAVSGAINEAAHTISVTVPAGTNVTTLVPTIAHSGVSINPASGAAQNFSSPVTYTVTAADGTTQPYIVTVTVAASSTKAITAFSFASPAVSGVINEGAHTIAVTVPAGTNVTALVPTIAHSGVSINPGSGVAQNFTGAVTYTVTAADASTQAYTVTVTINPAQASSKIAFVTKRDGTDQIYVMDPTGNNPINLSKNTEFDGSPAWSPDRTKLAFVSGHDIFVMSAVDGSGRTKLTEADISTYNESPTWSPDGTKIAFVSRNLNGNSEIYVMTANGENETNFTQHPTEDIDPDWSPDGAKIMFASGRDGNDLEIFVMDANNRSILAQLTTNNENDFQPKWSPDGNRIAFVHFHNGMDDIFVMDATGQNQLNLTAGSALVNDSPSWSPDGTKIAFYSGRLGPSESDGDAEIYAMDIQGGNLVNLTNNISITDSSPAWSP